LNRVKKLSMKRVLVIIPAYNEEAVIVQTVRCLEEAADYDYLVVNDGSTDGTQELLRANRLRHVRLPVNLGIGGAVQTGYQYAVRNGYDYAVQLDADGQHHPRDIVRLVETAEETGCDMVIGSRFVEDSGYRGSRARRAGIYYFSGLIRLLTGLRITDPTSGYRIVSRRAMERFALRYPGDYPEVEVLVDMARCGYRVKEISVRMSQRQGGESSITPARSVYYMAKVTVFSMLRAVM
jgi:glycosyltransferase involved in cell wall biosynthesis